MISTVARTLAWISLAALLVRTPAASQSVPPYDTQQAATRPLAPADAAAQWKFPEGFSVTVFAAEPDVRQPIAMALDDRGRLWVAENDTYAEVRQGFATNLHDRILVFEDTNHDGRFDRRTVFLDGLQHLTSLELGFGGVWALTSPTLVFIPDRDGDDRPDGPAEVKLDGFEWQRNHHTLANGLRWGPDGWLYGRHGIQAVSEIGVPGTPSARRARTNGGIWRYHPTRHTVEIVCHGTTNPWGLDWNAHGEAFFINTVIGHLWHVIPGAHYRRMHGTDLVPNVYEVIEQTADHFHWATGQEDWHSWRKLGTTSASSAAGGGHAHTGLLFYSGNNWPNEWRGRLLTINFNGRRLNSEAVTRVPNGSGYVGHHQPDLGFSADPWFRGIDLIEGPDGGVFIADWSDTGECHDDDGVFRSSGRIYKVTHRRTAPTAGHDVGRLAPADLVSLLEQSTEFFPRHARRRFQELRQQESAPGSRTNLNPLREQLWTRFRQSDSTIAKLRLLWSLHAIDATHPEFFRSLLADPDEHVRAWAIRLLVDDPAALAADPHARNALVARAAIETSALVRLALASALQRLPLADRAALARPLLARAEDAADHNLPAMLWYGIEPLAASRPDALAELGRACQLPLTLRCLSRRLAQERESSAHAEALATLLAHAARQTNAQAAVLTGLFAALHGQRQLAPPRGWTEAIPAFAASSDPRVQSVVRALGAIFADPRAQEAQRAAVGNASLPTAERRAALRSLIDARAAGLAEICEAVLSAPDLGPTAVDGLVTDGNPALADRVIARWSNLPPADRGAILSAMLSRRPWAERVLAAVAAGQLPRPDLTSFHARQIRAFRNPDLDRQLAATWGTIRDIGSTGADHLARITHWKQRLTPDALRTADLAHGRTVFNRVCGVCHLLNGEGGRLGPDLTGSARDNLDYLLPNIVDPSAAVAREFQMVTLNLKDGRSLSGLLRSRDSRTAVLQTLSETMSVPVTDIEDTQESALSLMPDGLLDSLPDTDVPALIAYLMKI